MGACSKHQTESRGRVWKQWMCPGQWYMISSGYAKISHSTVATVQSEKEAKRCKYVPPVSGQDVPPVSGQDVPPVFDQDVSPVSGQGVSDLESRCVKLL